MLVWNTVIFAALQLNQKYIKALQRRAGAYEKTEKYAESIKDLTAICLVLVTARGLGTSWQEVYRVYIA